MSFDYVRKLVSGKKARFIDPEAAVNLDLVYVTDRIIIMGYPATGFAGLYRNKRRDVLKFITSRHGEKWWIWNLCPLYENAYSPESMHNRVSRYPFPDHHPPPLPLLPLAVREMTAWLEGDEERIAIIHCKAGKGRSGTLLCSYLLSLPSLPPPPEMDRSYSYKELAKRLAQREETDKTQQVSASSGDGKEGWVYIGGGKDAAGFDTRDSLDNEGGTSTPARSEKVAVAPVGTQDGGIASSGSSTTTVSRPSLASSEIEISSNPPYDPIDIGDEGEAGDQGQQDRVDGRVDEVFKLHSSRRMKPTSTGRGVSIPSQRRWCRYIHLLFNNQAPPSYLSPKPQRLRLLSVTLLITPMTGWQKSVASLVVGSGGTGQGHAWTSVARYDDEYVEDLKIRGGTGEGVAGDVTWGGVAGEGKHDTHKMFRSCGKMVATDLDDDIKAVLPADHEQHIVHHLTPSHSHLTLDRSREFRLKFHLANLPLGWAWLIPAFHLPEASAGSQRVHTLTFPHSQLDFAVGPGAALQKVLVRLEEVAEGEEGAPARLLDDEEERREGVDDGEKEDKVKESED
ncbi:hypothetical protein L198_00269 [Cryptococcus wingfieldii CBS 7118]|uniref:phosphatidylinositol-3,4,5-trisphosphate 3-phosphatase n=1 Tax=Cryptococcus wingfieldii CBS 7118 TaxID=1295528 RepID=A0A1E3K625_9TREE|nr:hypothetical protein L198_00269 [Cryptococcus wingfieldii CBS 7118]ODO08539.1 hypothetical protein L198_00269 [Cryptococcus wingfieldii CBS 7118]